MLITTIRQTEIAFQSDRNTQLHITEDTHLMAYGFQGSGLIEAELTAIGRKKRWYLEYMHLFRNK